jgi:hypothetical protein
MNGPFERYEPRQVSRLDPLSFPSVDMKAYALVASGQSIEDGFLAEAERFVVREVLPSIAETGDNNGLGFLIVHPGSLGLSVVAHWWIQGSVLCQRFYRRLYVDDTPLNMAARPSIGCVWEMAIIQQEQTIWKETMMTEHPDGQAYLARHADIENA